MFSPTLPHPCTSLPARRRGPLHCTLERNFPPLYHHENSTGFILDYLYMVRTLTCRAGAS